MLWGGRWRDVTIVAGSNAMERPMPQQLDDLSRSLTPLEQDSTIISVIEMSQASWLVAGIVPGIERHPLKKLEPSAGLRTQVNGPGRHAPRGARGTGSCTGRGRSRGKSAQQSRVSATHHIHK